MTITTKTTGIKNSARSRKNYYLNGVRTSRENIEKTICACYRAYSNEVIQIDSKVAEIDFHKIFVRAHYMVRELNIVFTDKVESENTPDNQPANITAADTDGSEDDRDDDNPFDFLPDLDELNDVDTPEAEDQVITAEVKPEDNFSAKLAELQAKRDAAQAALLKAQEEHENAERLLQNFLSDTAGNLATQLHELNNTLDYSIELVTEHGYLFTVSDFDNIYIDSFGDGKTFAFTDWRSRKYATYDTPAQVEKVIGLLKAAIVRGDKKFTFPTVDELSDADKTALADSLTRAMAIALVNFQAFCRARNLMGAANELKLYNICRKALSELWRSEAA